MFSLVDGAGDKGLANRTRFEQIRKLLASRWQFYIDKLTPHIPLRWGITAGLFFVYLLRVYFGAGWYIVTYGLGIYILNLFIGFLSPQIDPESEDLNEEDEGPSLPMSREEQEFKPFIRKLPEFKFWYSITKAILISLALTMTRLTDIPVFWPILVVYFIVLFVFQMRKQIKHMIKHKYVPFSRGKRVYKGKDDSIYNKNKK